MFSFALVEGQLEVAVMQKMLQSIGIEPPTVVVAKGGGRFWSDVPRINRSARNLKVFGLVDLEAAACPSALLAEHLGNHQEPGFVLRIAVRMIESWLMADRDEVANAFGIATHKVPNHPDESRNPKRDLINAARGSRLKSVRDSLVPTTESGALVGMGYVRFMGKFAKERWRPGIAAEVSPSLNRALLRLQELT